MEFEGGLSFDVRPPATVSPEWRQLAHEFFGHVDPDLTRLVITDRYESVVGEWQQQTPTRFGDQGSAVYVANKIDGTRAAAKTVVLDGRRSVVIASAGTLNLGENVARWMLTHEAQHVRLHEQDAAAWAVQRRSGQEIVSPRPWEFVWSAQNAIDEYRCERAVHSKIPPIEPTYNPADFRAVMRRLEEARSAWTTRRDLALGHEIVTQVIDR